VIRACVELGARNPIVSIHDQGAGGSGTSWSAWTVVNLRATHKFRAEVFSTYAANKSWSSASHFRYLFLRAMRQTLFSNTPCFFHADGALPILDHPGRGPRPPPLQATC
jgi:hypothetical protein